MVTPFSTDEQQQSTPAGRPGILAKGLLQAEGCGMDELRRAIERLPDEWRDRAIEHLLALKDPILLDSPKA